MKTLILFATKHGAAGEIAQQIADKMDNAVIHDLKQKGSPSLDEFDCIIIGSSIYAGMIRKEAKLFLSKNAKILQEKKLGLFLCGMDRNRENEYFSVNFPPELLEKAKITKYLGGIFDPKKTGFLERLIVKTAAKQTDYINSIDENKIRQFAEALENK